jgi:hypothetical protein
VVTKTETWVAAQQNIPVRLWHKAFRATGSEFVMEFVLVTKTNYL